MRLVPDDSDKAYVHVIIEGLREPRKGAVWICEERFKKSFEIVYGWDDQNQAWVYSTDSGIYYWSEAPNSWQQHTFRNTSKESIPKFITDAEPQLLKWIKNSPK